MRNGETGRKIFDGIDRHFRGRLFISRVPTAAKLRRVLLVNLWAAIKRDVPFCSIPRCLEPLSLLIISPLLKRRLCPHRFDFRAVYRGLLALSTLVSFPVHGATLIRTLHSVLELFTIVPARSAIFNSPLAAYRNPNKSYASSKKVYKENPLPTF